MPLPAGMITFNDIPRPLKRKGSRAQLATRFFADLHAAWEEMGESALARAAFHNPVAFASMVARLMPHKIELTMPTDGMSDERLGDLIELADRMASLRAGIDVIDGQAVPVSSALAHSVSIENDLSGNSADEGGGGPRLVGVSGVRRFQNTHSGHIDHIDLEAADHIDLEAADHTAEPPLNFAPDFPAAPLSAEMSNKLSTSETPIPYPVGRAVPLSDAGATRRNQAKLTPTPTVVDEPFDPNDLF